MTSAESGTYEAGFRVSVTTILARGLIHEVNNAMMAVNLTADLGKSREDADDKDSAFNRIKGASQSCREPLDAMRIILADDPHDPDQPVPCAQVLEKALSLCALCLSTQVTLVDESEGAVIALGPGQLMIAAAALVLLNVDRQKTEAVSLTVRKDPAGWVALSLSDHAKPQLGPDLIATLNTGLNRLCVKAEGEISQEQDGRIVRVSLPLSHPSGTNTS